MRLPINLSLLRPHRFSDAMTYCMKIVIFLTPLPFGTIARYVPFGISRWS